MVEHSVQLSDPYHHGLLAVVHVNAASGSAPIDILFGNPGSLRNLSEWARQAVEAAGVAYQSANERLYMQSLNSAKKLDLRRDVHQGFELGDSVIVVKGSDVINV